MRFTETNYLWVPAHRHLVSLSKGCRVADVGGKLGSKWQLDNSTTIGWEGDVKVDLDNFTDTSWLDGIDFVHSRHTLEDLANPERLIKAMQQVPSGWIECPSPLAENTADLQVEGFRGYVHHRWFVGTDNGELVLIPKYPSICTIQMTAPRDLVKLLELAIHWNVYYEWSPENPLKYRILKHGVDFDVNDQKTYVELIIQLESNTIRDNQSKPFYTPAPQEVIA